MEVLTCWRCPAALVVAALLVAACSTAATSSPYLGSWGLLDGTHLRRRGSRPRWRPRRHCTASPISPLEPGGSPTLRPAMEVDGRLTLRLETPATALGGAATCDIAEGADKVWEIRVQEAGRVGGHRVYASLTLCVGRDRSPERVHAGRDRAGDGEPSPGCGDAAVLRPGGRDSGLDRGRCDERLAAVRRPPEVRGAVRRRRLAGRRLGNARVVLRPHPRGTDPAAAWRERRSEASRRGQRDLRDPG